MTGDEIRAYHEEPSTRATAKQLIQPDRNDRAVIFISYLITLAMRQQFVDLRAPGARTFQHHAITMSAAAIFRKSVAIADPEQYWTYHRGWAAASSSV